MNLIEPDLLADGKSLIAYKGKLLLFVRRAGDVRHMTCNQHSYVFEDEDDPYGYEVALTAAQVRAALLVKAG